MGSTKLKYDGRPMFAGRIKTSGLAQGHHTRPFEPAWSAASTTAADSTFHQLAPYIGRMKTSMARSLVSDHSRKGDLIVDPFAGCGVVALEAAASGRHVLAGDWNPYAVVLTRAKLFPPPSLMAAERRLRATWTLSRKKIVKQDLRTVPRWIRKFFHGETLRSALAFRDACIARQDFFLLACLLGILHHQRPGFLSYPSSHLVPYLRERKFPREIYPEMYKERDVLRRLEAKVRRAFRRPPQPFSGRRCVLRMDAREFPRIRNVRAVVTSPPYMNELDYVRDNRLRLWFIERSLPKGLELSGRDRKAAFVELMRAVCLRLAPGIKHGGYFVLVVGDVTRGNGRTVRTSRLTRSLFEQQPELDSFRLRASYHDSIPDIRRSRRECRGTKSETILIYQKCNRRWRVAKAAATGQKMGNGFDA
jgi:D12 class N6 adenine-specific DNA methyltransferase